MLLRRWEVCEGGAGGGSFPRGRRKKKKTKERKWRGKLCRRGGKISFPVVGGGMWKEEAFLPTPLSAQVLFKLAAEGLWVWERESRGKWGKGSEKLDN